MHLNTYALTVVWLVCSLLLWHTNETCFWIYEFMSTCSFVFWACKYKQMLKNHEKNADNS